MFFLQNLINTNKVEAERFDGSIDLRVYKLYELTHAEVLVIDPNFGLSAAAYERLEN
jgi:hypothetical protein